MLALWMFFWDWDGAPPVAPVEEEQDNSKGSGGKRHPRRPRYQSHTEDWWAERERLLIKLHTGIETEEDMRKNKELEEENKLFKDGLATLESETLVMRSNLTAIQQENAALQEQLQQVSGQLANPIVQAVLQQDWESVRKAMLDHATQSAPEDILAIARSLRSK